MAHFESKLYADEIIITDDTLHYAEPPKGYGKGRLGPAGYSSGGGYTLKPLPKELIVPESEWLKELQFKEENGTLTSQIIKKNGPPPKNQQQTNYCWINAAACCQEIIRELAGEEYVDFSPASAGGPITGFQNVGGYGSQGLRWVAEHGFVPTKYWPANAIDKKYYTADNKAIALNYRFTDWYELQIRSIEEVVACLLANIPVSVGYNWWGHQVTLLDLVRKNNRWGFRFYNSWGAEYGDGGMAILQGSQMFPDDAIAPFRATAA